MIASDKNVYFIATRFLTAAEQFNDPCAAKHKLTRLAQREVIKTAEIAVVVVRRVELVQTIVPGQPHDFCDALASDLHRRWSTAQPAVARLYWPSQRTTNLLGAESSGNISNLDAVSHDLGVTAVALALFAASSTFLEAWIPESRFADVFGLAKPDGAIADAGGVRFLIEFCGRYNADRLNRLASLADRVKLPVNLFTIADTK